MYLGANDQRNREKKSVVLIFVPKLKKKKNQEPEYTAQQVIDHELGGASFSNKNGIVVSYGKQSGITDEQQA